MASRLSKFDCLAMPSVIGLEHLKAVCGAWPLGNTSIRAAAGKGWTDCLIWLDDRIRLGGATASRRVRYDGALYIVHKGRKVRFTAGATVRLLDAVSYLYGLDASDDVAQNAVFRRR